MSLLDIILPEFAELERVSVADIAQQTGEAEHQEITSAGKKMQVLTSSYNSFQALEMIRGQVERRIVEPEEWLFLVAGIKRLEYQGDYHCMETAYLFSIALNQEIMTMDPFVSPYSREVFEQARKKIDEREIYLAVTKQKAPFPNLKNISGQFLRNEGVKRWTTIGEYVEFMYEHYSLDCQTTKSLWSEVWVDYNNPKFDQVWEEMASLSLEITRSQLITSIESMRHKSKIVIYSEEFFKPALDVLT